MNIRQQASNIKEYLIQTRRDFHQNPELGLNEIRTSRRIKEELQKFGIHFRSLAKTGVVAQIRGKNENPIVALRADMDALGVVEANDVEYKSQNPGIMHACGHDGHTAMLLGAAKILNNIRNELQGSVRLIFQPAEEVMQGAKMMVKEGVLDGVSSIFGIHLWSDLDVGKISLEEGPRTASADVFRIEVEGKGTHGSLPHKGIDAVLVSSSIINNLQSVVSREINPLEPAVISVGTLNAGTQYNILAQKAVMEGTTRCFNKGIRDGFPEIIERISSSTAKAHRAKAKVMYEFGTPPTINDASYSRIAVKAAKGIAGENCITNMQMVPIGEDFAIYLERVPGVLAFVGVRNEEIGIVHPLHSDRFDIDEDALEIGCALYAQTAVESLKEL